MLLQNTMRFLGALYGYTCETAGMMILEQELRLFDKVRVVSRSERHPCHFSTSRMISPLSLDLFLLTIIRKFW